MRLPEFLRPLDDVSFGPVSGVVGGVVAAALIAMAAVGSLQAPKADDGATLAQVSSSWNQQVSDQADKLRGVCTQAGAITVPDSVASDSGVQTAAANLNTAVKDSCASGTLHDMQEAIFGDDTRAWSQTDVDALVTAGGTATSSVQTAIDSLNSAVSQAQLATVLPAFLQAKQAADPVISQAQQVLTVGPVADQSTVTALQTQITTCQTASATNQTSPADLATATPVLQQCVGTLSSLTTAVAESQQAYQASQAAPTIEPTQTSAPEPTQTSAPKPVQTSTPKPAQTSAPKPTHTVAPVQPAQTTQTTHATGRAATMGMVQISQDSGTSVQVSVAVSDPDRVGFSICLYNGSQLAGKFVRTGSQTIAATVAVSPSTPRDPMALFC